MGGTRIVTRCDAWLERYEGRNGEPVAKIREFILAVDPAVTEAIKRAGPHFYGTRAPPLSSFPKTKRTSCSCSIKVHPWLIQVGCWRVEVMFF